MNSLGDEDSQRNVDNDIADLSVTLMADARQNAELPSSFVKGVLDEIDAIPVTAEYAITADTPQDIGQAVEAEREALLDAVLADLDLGEPSRFKRLHKLYNEAHVDDIEHHKRYGHIKQGLDAIDDWRRTPEGKEHRTLTRKEKRHLKAEAEGKTIKPRRSNLTDEERKRSNADRQAKHRATVPVKDQSEDRQGRRVAARERTEIEVAKALADRAIFRP